MEIWHIIETHRLDIGLMVLYYGGHTVPFVLKLLLLVLNFHLYLHLHIHLFTSFSLKFKSVKIFTFSLSYPCCLWWINCFQLRQCEYFYAYHMIIWSLEERNNCSPWASFWGDSPIISPWASILVGFKTGKAIFTALSDIIRLTTIRLFLISHFLF